MRTKLVRSKNFPRNHTPYTPHLAAAANTTATMLPNLKRPGNISTSKIPPSLSASEPSTPTLYPKLLVSFTKLFWQTSQNVQIQLYRLAPTVFTSQVCLVATDMEKGEELSRLFFDQMHLELLLLQPSHLPPGVSSLDKHQKKFLPLIGASSTSAAIPIAPDLARVRPYNSLDGESKALQKFFDIKLQLGSDGIFVVRGLPAMEEGPIPIEGSDENAIVINLPKRRKKALTYDQFEDMHKAMTKGMESVRRNTTAADSSMKASRRAMESIQAMNDMVASLEERRKKMKTWSVSKIRWKRACRRVVMDAAVLRTREHLTKIGFALK